MTQQRFLMKQRSHEFPTEGKLYTWGDNPHGCLGLGDTTDRCTPVQVGSATNWVKGSVGVKHSLFINSAGELWACGYNSQGELGDGSTTNSTTLVEVGGTTWGDAICVIAGWNSSKVIKADGTLWSWGSGGHGRIGDATTTSKSSPINIGAALNPWTWVSSGYNGYTGIANGGRCYSWGYGTNGENGIGDTLHICCPVQVATANTGWEWCDKGNANHAMGINGGRLYTWGASGSGENGRDKIQTSCPVIVGARTDWQFGCSNGNGTMFVSDDGELWGCGYNGAATRFLMANSGNKSSPVLVDSSIIYDEKIMFTGQSAYHVRNDGTLWTYAYNGQGQLGVGNTTNNSSPQQVGTLNTWKQYDGTTHGNRGAYGIHS